MPSFEFEENRSDEEQGIAHSDIEPFKSRPYGAVARECGQNSNDAALTKHPRVNPVELSFDVIRIKADDYPARESHRETLTSCLKEVEKTDTKTRDFFTRAIEVLDSPIIPVLAIRDTETTGLLGPATANSPFKALLKGKGTSRGKGPDAGGNFGIGKGAAFAASEIHTVFYSTLYLDPTDNSEKYLAQGKTRLITHTDNNNIKRKSDGYWGSPGGNMLAIETQENVPEWLRRTKIGTTVAIAGFKDKSEWQAEMAVSLLINFFPALHRKEIRCTIDGGAITLDSASMAARFSDSTLAKAAQRASLSEDFENARNLYECLSSESATEHSLLIPDVGSFTARLLVKDGMQKKVMIARNGMVITDSLKHFGQKFERFPNSKDFVLLVETADTAASSLLRKLENPEHDELSAERISDPLQRKKIDAAMVAFATTLRDLVRRNTLPEFQERSAIDELAKYFSDKDRFDAGGQGQAEENPEKHVFNSKEVEADREAVNSAAKGGDRGGRGASKGGGGGAQRGRGSGVGGGQGGRGSKARRSVVELDAVRNFAMPRGARWHREIRFTPRDSGTAHLLIAATGINDSETLNVVEADGAQKAGGGVTLQVVAGERHAVRIKFDRPYYGPLEITAHEGPIE
jgi:hypothetical protein